MPSDAASDSPLGPTPRPALPWTRLGAELLTIVLGILLAFGIDAWWDGRSAARAEQVLLTSLRSEMLDNRETLEISLASHREHARVAEWLLDGDPSASADALVTAVAISTYIRTTDVHAGTIGSAIEGGALEQITNVELRALIASWPGDFNDIVENEEQEWSILYDGQLPLIGRYVDPYELAAATRTWGVDADDRPDVDADAVAALRVDPAFRTLLFERLINDQTVVDELEALLEGVERTLALLEDEIGA